jgi:hypothetical protein
MLITVKKRLWDIVGAGETHSVLAEFVPGLAGQDGHY